MSTIHILPEYLANQIAAGEVVQRPESVVKELVENALDAGATSISVVVRNAGKQAVHVIDDGKGMNADDLVMSIVRHATSKIASESDLHAIRTLGFRGEALASIAAVADVEIRSKHRDAHQDETGHLLTSKPGTPPTRTPIAMSPGTQILVRNLFYNVPARRKFLKSDLTEFRHVSETMQRMALSRPDVRFTFYDGDTLVFDVRPSDLYRRCLDILGLEGGSGLLAVDGNESGIAISGFVGLPRHARQSRSGQYLFLNQRPIVSRQLAHAVLTAYEHLLEHGQHPVFVLHVTIDPHRVDVNVHPQKHEVKFDDERSAYLLVQSAVTQALRKAEVIPSFLADVPIASSPLQSLPQQTGFGTTYVNRLTGEITHGGGHNLNVFQGFGSTGAVRSAPSSMTPSMFSAAAAPSAVLQIGLQYVVTSTQEGLVVIDQHAAHERILYEKALQRGNGSKNSEQSLLFSVRVALAPSDVVVLREYAEQLQTLGFRFDVHDGTTVEVHAVPTDVMPGSEEEILGAILDSLRSLGMIPRDRRTEGVAAVYAAKQAIRKGIRLTTDEMQKLVSDLFACTTPHTSPSGVPTYMIIPFDELATRLR